jgi:PAS domain-containing protein
MQVKLFTPIKPAACRYLSKALRIEQPMRNNQPITQRERTFPAQQRLISTTNAKGVITYCNDAFVEISGFPARN